MDPTLQTERPSCADKEIAMYRRLIITIIGFLLVFSPVAIAQQDNPSANAPKSMTGEIDVGYRATDTAGDAAQYERYRDLRDRVHSNIEFTLDPGKYFQLQWDECRLP